MRNRIWTAEFLRILLPEFVGLALGPGPWALRPLTLVHLQEDLLEIQVLDLHVRTPALRTSTRSSSLTSGTVTTA